jgi:hypothetical protein
MQTTSMPLAGFQPTIPVFKRAKTFHASERAATVTGWSLTLGHRNRLRVFMYRVLRRRYEPKRDKIIGGRRKLNSDELHNLYFSPDIIRIINQGG